MSNETSIIPKNEEIGYYAIKKTEDMLMIRISPDYEEEEWIQVNNANDITFKGDYLTRIDDFNFEKEPALFPKMRAVSFVHKYPASLDGYIVRANQEYYNTGDIVEIKVLGNEKLNRTVFVVEDDITTEEMQLMLINELDVRYFGTREIQANRLSTNNKLAEFEMNLEYYQGKNIEDDFDFS